MPSIGTTAQMVLSSTPSDPVSFELHADADNTDTINYNASGDPTVTLSNGELLPGQSITVSDFAGALYIVAETGTQTYGLPFVQYRSRTGTNLEVVKQ